MSNVLVDAGFEKGFQLPAGAPGFDANTTPGSISLDTGTFKHGAQALKITGNAANTNVTKNINVSAGSLRFYFQYTGSITATCTICQIVNASANMTIQILTTGKLRLQIGATSFTSTTTALSASTWYLLDFNWDSTGTTFTTNAKLSDTSGALLETFTPGSKGSLSAIASTKIQLGQITASASLTCFFDDFKSTDSTADYPIGAGSGPTNWVAVNQAEFGSNAASVAINVGSVFNDSWDAIGTGTPTYSSTQAKRGTLSFSFLQANGGTQTNYVEWNTLGSLTEQVFTRFYFYNPAAPSQNIRLHAFNNGSNALCAAVLWSSSGTLQGVNAAGTTIGSPSSTLPTAQWIRVEVTITPNTSTGALRVRAWWTDPDSDGAADYDSNLTSQVLGANIDRVRTGICTTTTAFVGAFTFYIDDIQATDIAAIGPSSRSETGTATVTTTPSMTEIRTHFDAGTSSVGTVPSMVEVPAHYDTGTPTVGVTASGVETRAHADSGTSLVTTTPSVSLIAGYDDVGTALVTVAPTGSTETKITGYLDDSIGGWVADVASAFSTGTVTSLSATFNANVPTGSLLMASVCGSSASISSFTDTHGMTWTLVDSVTIGGGTQIHHAVYQCLTTTDVHIGDTATAAYSTSAGGAAIVVSAYVGVNATPVDTLAVKHAAQTSGTSLTLTGSHVTAQALEAQYTSFCYTGAATNPVFQQGWNIRTQVTTTGSQIRTIQVLDKTVYATGTFSQAMSWTGTAQAAGIFVPIKMDKLPMVVGITPSDADIAQYVEAGTANVNTTPHLTDIAQYVETGKPVVSAIASGVAGTFTVDAATASVTTSQPVSFELYAKNDFGTCLVTTSIPFRQNLFRGHDVQTVTVTTLPSGIEGTPLLDSCIHVTLEPRWASAPVGASWTGRVHVRYVASVRKRWSPVNVGKCPS